MNAKDLESTHNFNMAKGDAKGGGGGACAGIGKPAIGGGGPAPRLGQDGGGGAGACAGTATATLGGGPVPGG